MATSNIQNKQKVDSELIQVAAVSDLIDFMIWPISVFLSAGTLVVCVLTY